MSVPDGVVGMYAWDKKRWHGSWEWSRGQLSRRDW